MGRVHATAVVTAIRVQGACSVGASTCRARCMSSRIMTFICSRFHAVWALGVSDILDVPRLRGLPSSIICRISGLPATSSLCAGLVRASAASARLHCLCCSCLCLFVVVPCLLPIALRYKVEAVVTALRIVSGCRGCRAFLDTYATMAHLE